MSKVDLMVDSIPLRSSLSLQAPHYPLSQKQKSAEALISGFVSHSTDGYSLTAMVGGGLVYRLGKLGTIAIGSRLLTPYTSPLTSRVLRLTSVGIGFTGEVFTFEAGQRALRVKFGGADPSLLRFSGENGLGRGLIGAAIILGPLKGAGVFAQGQNPVLQHLFQDSAMVLAQNVSDRIFTRRGTLQRAPTLAEQFINAEATLWQMNAGMSLVHGVFPVFGQINRSLDVSRSYVGAALRLRTSPLEGGRPTSEDNPIELSHPLFNEPLPAFAGKESFPSKLEKQSTNEMINRLHIQKMSAQGEDGELDFKLLAKEAKNNPEALEFLAILARNRNVMALWAVSQAAEENTAAARLLMELSFIGSEVANRLLFQLRMGHHIQRAFHHRDPIYLLRDLAMMGHGPAQLGFIEVAKTQWEALQLLLHVSITGAGFAQRALADLDVSAYSHLARSSVEIPPVLRVMVWEGNTIAFEVLSRAAKINPHAVLSLHDLAERGHWASKKFLATLAIKYFVRRAKKDPEALRILRILAGHENGPALKALLKIGQKNDAVLYSSNINRETPGRTPSENDPIKLLRAARRNNKGAINKLFELASDGNEGALKALGEAAENRREALAALIILDQQAVSGVRRLLLQMNLEYYFTGNPFRGEKAELLRYMTEIGHRESLDLFVSRATFYRTTPALTFLSDLARKNHLGALRGLAEAAKRNPNAIKILLELHSEGHDEAGRLLQNLKGLSYYLNLSLFGDEEAFQTLCLLADFGNMEAYRALIQSVEYNRNQVEALARLAQIEKEFSIWILSEASQYTPIAILALVELAKQGNILARNKISVLRVRPILERAMENRLLQKETFEALRALKEMGNSFAREALETLPIPEEQGLWQTFYKFLRSMMKAKPKS